MKFLNTEMTSSQARYWYFSVIMNPEATEDDKRVIKEEYDAVCALEAERFSRGICYLTE